MSNRVIEMAKEFHAAEGGISGYTFWNELETKFAKLGIELSYQDWNELESILVRSEEA